MFLIVGLGNPGKKYEKTRHNLGFMAIDFLVNQYVHPQLQSWSRNKKAKCLSLKSKIKERKIKFIKPQTFMNNSGFSIKHVQKQSGLKPKNIIVIYDELDLPFGTIRVRNKGSSAGHKGVQSIIDYLESDKFWRIRIGIRNEKADLIPVEKFVLQKFSKQEQKDLKEKILPEVVEKIKEII